MYKAWRTVGWALFLVAVLSAVYLIAVAAELKISPAIAAGIIAIAGVVGGPLAEAGARALGRSIGVRRLAARRLRQLCAGVVKGRLPLIERSDPVRLGVHPARTVIGPASDPLVSLPPYVIRDRDDYLRSLMTRESFVIVVGPSAAGKSRMAYEAVRAVYPGRRLVAPRLPERNAIDSASDHPLASLIDERLLTGDSVIWLDDLEQHLTLGLAPDDIEAVLKLPRVLVVATIRLNERERFFSGGFDNPTRSPSLIRNGRQILRMASEVRLERRFTRAELVAAKRLSWDPRIREAMKAADRFGIAEFLAGAPDLTMMWNDAWDVGGHPTGAAIVEAAVDCRRIGLAGPIQVELLKDLYRPYLLRVGGAQLRPESFEEGLAWSAKPVHGTAGLLVPSPDGRGYSPFDYLVDSRQADPEAPIVLAETWRTVIERTPADQISGVAVGVYIARIGNSVESENLLAAVAGSSDAMFEFGELLQRAYRRDDAEFWYRLAAEAGHIGAMHELGGWRWRSRVDQREAEDWNRRAAEKGHSPSMAGLAALLKGRGDLTGAEYWYRKAIESGHTSSRYYLGELLASQGHVDDAMKWYTQAADADDSLAIAALAKHHENSGNDSEAERLFKILYDKGNDEGLRGLMRLVERRGGHPWQSGLVEAFYDHASEEERWKYGGVYE